MATPSMTLALGTCLANLTLLFMMHIIKLFVKHPDLMLGRIYIYCTSISIIGKLYIHCTSISIISSSINCTHISIIGKLYKLYPYINHG